MNLTADWFLACFFKHRLDAYNTTTPPARTTAVQITIEAMTAFFSAFDSGSAVDDDGGGGLANDGGGGLANDDCGGPPNDDCGGLAAVGTFSAYCSSYPVSLVPL